MKNKKQKRWFLLALIAALAAAPHATVVRVVVDDADPFYWLLTRFIIGTLVMLPVLLLATNWSKVIKARRYVLLAAICISLATAMYNLAIYYSQASYVSILTMLTPIILILVSARFFREKITARKIAGVMIAMIGAMVVVLLPFIASQQYTSAVYPLATALAIGQSFLYVAALIAMRKANEAGVSILTVTGITMPVGALVVLPMLLILGDFSRLPVDYGFFAAAAYSALGVAVLIRAVHVVAYENIGAFSTAGLEYLQTLVAIILPLLLIDEKLSIEMVVGGILIMLGVYLIQAHKRQRARRRLEQRYY